MSTLREALDAYRADPVNVYDRPESWQALDALLDACDATLAADPSLRTLSGVEKEIASIVQVAESNAVLAEYLQTLPDSLFKDKLEHLVEQGFDAGYMAACKKVLAVITKMKAGAQ